MSRGSTLTLFKKFDLKMGDNEFNSIVKKYASYNKEHDYHHDKKNESEYTKDIPLIMSINPFVENGKYDEKTSKWIDTRAKKTIDIIRNNIIGYVDSRDHMYCEELMTWDFGSRFDCVVEEYNLGHYNFSDCVMEITPKMAMEMLAAINYILGGEWSDKVERGMNNRFIKIFTEGYNCDSYWKYVYRNKHNSKKNTIKIKENGFDITIKCPQIDKNKDDVYSESEIDESNECIENALENFRSGLITFLKSDNWKRHDYNENSDGWFGFDEYDKYKYVLTYEFWG